MPNFTVLTISLFCMCSQPSQPQVENLVKEIRGLCQEAQVFCSTSKLLCAYSYLKKRIGVLQTIIDVSSSRTTFHYMQYHANWCLHKFGWASRDTRKSWSITSSTGNHSNENNGTKGLMKKEPLWVTVRQFQSDVTVTIYNKKKIRSITNSRHVTTVHRKEIQKKSMERQRCGWQKR